jgi:probable F420-dependent oxidoreductase
VPDIRIGLFAPYSEALFAAPSALTEFAGIAEECGVESVWTVEHVIEADSYEKLYPYSASGEMPGRLTPMADPLEMLSFFAATTTTLRLGTAVMVAPLHSPVVLAKRAATMDRLSGGRLELGLGIGWQKEEYSSVGVPFSDRGARLQECIDAMRALWGTQPASYQGKFVSFDRVHCRPTPAAGAIPIVLGGNSKAAIARCAVTAQGWFPHAIPPDDFAAGAEQLRTLAAAAGRPDAPAITVCPGTADYSKEMDVRWVRRYLEQGASRLVLHAGIAEPNQLAAFRHRLLRYREVVDSAATL